MLSSSGPHQQLLCRDQTTAAKRPKGKERQRSKFQIPPCPPQSTAPSFFFRISTLLPFTTIGSRRDCLPASRGAPICIHLVDNPPLLKRLSPAKIADVDDEDAKEGKRGRKTGPQLARRRRRRRPRPANYEPSTSAAGLFRYVWEFGGALALALCRTIARTAASIASAPTRLTVGIPTRNRPSRPPARLRTPTDIALFRIHFAALLFPRLPFASSHLRPTPFFLCQPSTRNTHRVDVLWRFFLDASS